MKLFYVHFRGVSQFTKLLNELLLAKVHCSLQCNVPRVLPFLTAFQSATTFSFRVEKKKGRRSWIILTGLNITANVTSVLVNSEDLT